MSTFFTDMDEVVVREILNAVWAVVVWGLVLVLGIFIWSRSLRGGPRRHYGWYNDLASQLALANFTYFLGEGIYRTWVFLLLLSYDHVDPGVFDIRDQYWIAFTAAFISFMGGLCLMRLYSKDSWGHKVWLITLLCMVAVGVFVRSLSL